VVVTGDHVLQGGQVLQEDDVEVGVPSSVLAKQDQSNDVTGIKWKHYLKKTFCRIIELLHWNQIEAFKKNNFAQFFF
jgi:hypothetical protein